MKRAAALGHLSSGALALLRAATDAEAAVDLEAGPPGRGDELARAVVELFSDADLSDASPRALWNLLWLSADLATQVDVYRAAELLAAVERLFARHFALRLDGPGPAAEAAEMAFDFFFNGRAQPLEALRFGDVVGCLGRVLALPNRCCRRAALHGLGHLRQRHDDDGPGRVALEVVIDAFVASRADPSLDDYARLARLGQVM